MHIALALQQRNLAVLAFTELYVCTSSCHFVRLCNISVFI
jgi:hypothetical protein